MTTILVADDEPSIRDAVSFHCAKEGLEVIAAKDGDEALERYEDAKGGIDLVILDIMMPGHGGYEVCSAIRDEDPCIPIIFLSAKNDLIDKNLGFKLGADDYVTKPFEAAELMMRVNACLRRRASVASLRAEDERDIAVFDDLEIRPRAREVLSHGERIDLTTREYDVLAFLAEKPGTVLTRQQILDAVWGAGYFGDAGVVAVFIRKLREKIEADPSKPAHILTEWGVGYRLV